jgi:dipeptidyl aminopeptidase/acylaminoacyl peptidase
MSDILAARGATRVRFSPDGAWLAFVTDRTGTPQLWRIPASGGTPQRLTDHDRVGAYRFSPDGRRIAYGADVGGSELWQLWVMDADGKNARKLSEQDERIHHLRGWTADGRALLVHANLRDRRYFDLHAYDVESGASRVLHRFDGTASDATPLEDGSVVVTTNRARGDENHLLLLSPDGATRQLTPDDPPALHDVICAVPGGLVVRSDRARDFIGLATIRLKDGEFRWRRSPPDRDVEAASSSGRLDAYAINDDGRSGVVIADGDADETVAGLPPGCLASDLIGDSLAFHDGKVAVAWGRYDAPSTIFVATRTEGARELVAPILSGVDPKDLPETTLVSWPTFDGRRIPGFLLTPRDAPKAPRPTIIEVHGGPEGQARPLWNPRTIALIASGFNVLLPNVRGSSGYGKAYRSLDDVRLRMDSVKDLDAAAAWLADAKIAPKDKIGVMGQSYGGYMVLAAIAFFPTRDWAAAVDVYGIANFVTFFEQTAEWRRPLRAVEYGDPAKDRDFLISISPITKLDAIKAPLMVIHGANDPRVPIVETEQIVKALRDRGREVEYLRYEDEGHSLAKAKNRADAYPKVLAFFQRHMGA